MAGPITLPGKAYREVRLAFERRRYDDVIAMAPRTLAALEADEAQRGYQGAVLCLGGACLAETERYPEAVAWLEAGLARLPDTPSAGELSGGHQHHRLLAELYLLLGRFDRADAYLEWLARPEQPIDSRLAATRGQAHRAAATGRFDHAFLLVNAAADLARRAHSRQLAALVEADRALVVAEQGRLHEAVTFADGVLPALSAPGGSPQQRWANAQAAVLLTTLARRCANGGDLLSAERFVLLAAEPVAATGRRYWAAHLELARAVHRRADGRPVEAEEPLREAVASFTELATPPALAEAHLEEARLAEALGLVRSAVERYARARAELLELGLPRPAAAAGDRLAALDAQA